MHQIIRALRPRDPQEHHRASTTLELFFDLVTVIAIASVTAGLHHGISEGHGLEMLPRFLFLFGAIWWCWMNFTWFASAFDNDDVPFRLLVMVIMLGELIFAGGAAHIFETLDFRFGIVGWIVMRLGMIGLWLRAAAGSDEYRTTCLRYAGGIALAQLGWVLFYVFVTPDSSSFYFWAVLVFLVELSAPVYAESHRPTPFHRHHIIERYGLLMIISLGEIMLSISHGFGSLFGDHPTIAAAVVSVSGLVIVFAVWWVYFCEEEHLTTSKMRQAVMWGYGHVFIFMSAALMGAAVAAEVDLVTDHSSVTQHDVAEWCGLALVLFCVSLWFVRDRTLTLPVAAGPGLARDGSPVPDRGADQPACLGLRGSGGGNGDLAHTSAPHCGHLTQAGIGLPFAGVAAAGKQHRWEARRPTERIMADDALVIFTPSGKRGRFALGTPVLTAARQLGVDLDSVCGGRGICSKCQITPGYGEFPKHGVTVDEDALTEWNAVEDRYKRIRGLPPGRRLGCQAKVMGDVVIDVPPESQVHKQVIRKSATERVMVMDPATRAVYVEVEEPDMHEPTGDFERLARALAAQWQVEAIEADLSVLRRLQPVLRKGEWKVTVVLHKGNHDTVTRVLDILPGFHEGPLLGLAVDLGSTTIAAHLCDLSDGKVLASSGLMNPQIRFGEDLMSRVSYAMMNPGGDVEMTRAVREAINSLASAIAEDAKVDPASIYEMVIVCNPVMHHLFLGVDPVELGQAPFALATSSSLSLDARELELTNLNRSARVYVLPCIAGHVGADCAAVALSEEPQKSKDMVLIVDVGTNAELLLGNETRVLACSSPTGPAFEGAQISSGQRAAPGAIERVEIDPVTKDPRFRVIGSDLWSDEPGFAEATKSTGVTGICGSGIIEAVAEMRLAGLLDPSGLIGGPEQTGTARCEPHGRTFGYLLHDGSVGGGPRITVLQGDIRAIQLAKSALYAGARLLMDEMGVETVDRVTLAGAFGAHISPKHAMVLGMIPDVPLDKVTSAGNAAGTGARIALCNVASRNQIEETVHHIHKVETAIEPRFQEHFVNANAIPHAVDPFPNLHQIVSLPEVSFNPKTAGDEGGRRRRRG